jgi:indole-3-glycerol phosphate synthase
MFSKTHITSVMNILEQIILQKRGEIEAGRKLRPVSFFEKQPLFKKATISLKASVLSDKGYAVITEFKRRSPSAGIINNRSKLKDVVKQYAEWGAAGISVLTDEIFFGGSLADLEAAVFAGKPLLRKDFIIDPWQIFEAKASGADAILLIASCLNKARIKSLADTAGALGLETLLELHHEDELSLVYEGISLVGINNRDLGNFAVDLEHSARMVEKLGKDHVKIAESGITNLSDLRYLGKCGFDGFLIGSLFMKEDDPGLAFKNFVQKLKQNKYGN